MPAQAREGGALVDVHLLADEAGVAVGAGGPAAVGPAAGAHAGPPVGPPRARLAPDARHVAAALEGSVPHAVWPRHFAHHA